MNKTYYAIEFTSYRSHSKKKPIAKATTYYENRNIAELEFKRYDLVNCEATLYQINEEDRDGLHYIQNLVIDRKFNDSEKKDSSEFTEEQKKAYDLVISTINYYVDCKYAQLLIDRVNKLVEVLSKHDN